MPNNPNNTVVSRHVLSVLVEDLDGIISRVSAMFTRRGVFVGVVGFRQDRASENQPDHGGGGCR